MRSENCAGDLNARITDRIKADLRKNFLEANLDEEYDMKKILYYTLFHVPFSKTFAILL